MKFFPSDPEILISSNQEKRFFRISHYGRVFTVQIQSSSTFKETEEKKKSFLSRTFEKQARKIFQSKSIGPIPKRDGDLVLGGSGGLDGRGNAKQGKSARVTVTGVVHDWPGFFGVTQVYIRSRLVHRRAIARVPLELTSRVVGGEIEAVLLMSSMGRARENASSSSSSRYHRLATSLKHRNDRHRTTVKFIP